MKKSTTASKSRFVDTNVFLRTLVREDEKTHKECVAFLTSVREGRVQAYTSPLVIAEMVWVLQSFYKLSKQEVLEAVLSVVRLRHLRIVARERVAEALTLYATHNIKFVDALIASAKDIENGTRPVVSYDRDFDRISGVVRKEPKKMII